MLSEAERELLAIEHERKLWVRANRSACPECGRVFTDPEQWAYGHDCEAVA